MKYRAKYGVNIREVEIEADNIYEAKKMASAVLNAKNADWLPIVAPMLVEVEPVPEVREND